MKDFVIEEKWLLLKLALLCTVFAFEVAFEIRRRRKQK